MSRKSLINLREPNRTISRDAFLQVLRDLIGDPDDVAEVHITPDRISVTRFADAGVDDDRKDLWQEDAFGPSKFFEFIDIV